MSQCICTRYYCAVFLLWLYHQSFWINTLRLRQDGRHFPDDIFKCIFLNENVWISIKISLKFVPKGPINNNPALVQIMPWRRSGDKPLSEPMMVSLLMHICVAPPQWVKWIHLLVCVIVNWLWQLHTPNCIIFPMLASFLWRILLKHVTGELQRNAHSLHEVVSCAVTGW